jgi:DNA-binding XRE family transcriptional regulator
MGTDESTDAKELGRRVRAARAYRDVTQTELGDELGHGRDTIGRWEKGEVDQDYKVDSFRRAAVKLTSMPEEFFVINFDDLPNMERAWKQVSRLPDPDELQSLVDERLRRGPRRR